MDYTQWTRDALVGKIDELTLLSAQLLRGKATYMKLNTVFRQKMEATTDFMIAEKLPSMTRRGNRSFLPEMQCLLKQPAS